MEPNIAFVAGLLDGLGVQAQALPVLLVEDRAFMEAV
jgi:hypothetical protein